MTQSILEIYDSCVNWIDDEQLWEYRNLDSVYFDSVKKDQHTWVNTKVELNNHYKGRTKLIKFIMAVRNTKLVHK